MNDDEDELVAKYKEHTVPSSLAHLQLISTIPVPMMLTLYQEKMLAEVEARWQQKWAAEGKEPPAEQPVEETVVPAGAQTGEQSGPAKEEA